MSRNGRPTAGMMIMMNFLEPAYVFDCLLKKPFNNLFYQVSYIIYL